MLDIKIKYTLCSCKGTADPGQGLRKFYLKKVSSSVVKVSSIYGFLNASICSVFQEGTLMADSEEELKSLLMKVRE